MKKELSSIDIKYIVEELQDLIGGKIQKIYHEDKELHLSIFVSGEGTKTLIAGGGKIFLTDYKIPHEKIPSSFCMFLRKRLNNQRITRIQQQEQERIVIINTEEYKLIIELFSSGNVILTDRKNKIITTLEVQKWKDRIIIKGEYYQLPPALNFNSITKKDLLDIIKSSEKQIVAFLAREMGLGGTYAEEVCLRLNIDKSIPANQLDNLDVVDILDEIKDLLKEKNQPQIIYENDEAIDVSPINLRIYENLQKKEFESFNEAVDEFFMKKKSEKITEEKENIVKEKENTLDYRLEQQKEASRKFDELDNKSKEKAELIYYNYSTLQNILNRIKEIVNEFGWNVVPEKLGMPNVKVDLIGKKAMVNLNGEEIVLDLQKSLEETASTYYDKSKLGRKKLGRVEEAISDTEEKMRTISLKEAVSAELEKKEVKNKRWYEKFRWFISSSGFLVVGGKDATTNEILVKKYVNNKDMVFHTELPGSPFVVVKTEGKEVDEETLKEAAQFTASYSKAWGANLAIVDVYWVNPDQISKSAPSGEYIVKGAFMIYGKKNWLKPELKVAIGFYNEEIIAGPVNSVESKTQKYAIIKPGYTPSKELAEQIRGKIMEMCKEDERGTLMRINIDDIQRYIPAGKGDLL